MACGWHVDGSQGMGCLGLSCFALGSGYVTIYLICPPLGLPSQWPTTSHTCTTEALSTSGILIIPRYSTGYKIFPHEVPGNEMKQAIPSPWRKPEGMGLRSRGTSMGPQLSLRSSGDCVALVGRSRSLDPSLLPVWASCLRESLTLRRRTRVPLPGRGWLRGWQENERGSSYILGTQSLANGSNCGIHSSFSPQSASGILI